MKQLTYQKAGPADLELLVKTRVAVLRAANRLPETADMDEVARQSRAYYETALADGSHTAYLVFDGAHWVGAGGVSFYRVMPTCHNPTGWKAYVMNLYTAPAYRRQGIARHVLGLLVQAARARGVTHITLEATPMGRPLYAAYGFVPMQDEMELPHGDDS